MGTATFSKTMSKGLTVSNAEVGVFLGRVVSFNNSLKLYHWHVTGDGSCSQHIALDQALADLLDVTDRLVETTYSLADDIDIVVPETKVPKDIVKHVSEFYDVIQDARKYYTEAFIQAIIDDYHEGLQQLLYRLKRLT